MDDTTGGNSKANQSYQLKAIYASRVSTRSYRQTNSPSMASCSSVLAKDTRPPITAPIIYTSHVKRPRDETPRQSGDETCPASTACACTPLIPSCTVMSTALELVDCSSSW